jgi:outer membrane receptor protein involved in Fe transport
VSPARALLVAGAFTGGGAQADLLRTETHIQMSSSLAWTRGTHLIQTGFQLPDWSRRGFFDQTNRGGTFYFAGLNLLAVGQPYSFVQQQGNGDVAFLEKQVGAYVKDDWQVKPGLTASVGLRYDWQNYFHDTNNFARRQLCSDPADRIHRPSAERFNFPDDPRTPVEMVQRSSAVRTEPREQRHERYRLVSGQRLRPLG